MKRILFYFKLLFFIPHGLFFLFSRKKILLEEELIQWRKVLRIREKSTLNLFFYLILNLKEYRSLFCYRIGGWSLLLSWYAHGMTNLYITIPSENVSKGLVIQHGHSTRIGPERCGAYCQIWHNVTIGKAYSGGKRPVLGNNIKVCAGSIILGDIVIGDNVTIGAGCIVVKSVPNNCVVVGNPARIVQKDGEKVNILL